ncbi:MAG: CBS domain-containing protein [Steroidobacteraceae bacterium]
MFVKSMLPTAGKRLITVGDDAPLIEAARLLRDHNVDLVAVCRSDGLLAGVISKSDVVRQISHCQGSACTTPTAAVMTRTVILCRPNDLLRDVWSVMRERGMKNIPVVNQDSRPVGVLNVRDVLEILLQEVESEEVLLRDYVMRVGYH